MIRPPRGSWSFISRKAPRVQRKAPVRLTSTTRRQALSDRSSRGTGGAPVPDASEGLGQLALYQEVAGPVGISLLRELREGGGVFAELLEAARELRGQSGAEPEALRREADRGLDEVLPRQLAEPLVCEVETGHRAGDSNRQVAEVMARAVVFSLLVEEHVRAGCRRGALSKIEGRRCSVLEHHDHEASSADIPGGGMGNGEGEGGRDSRIDGISAALQDSAAHLGGVEVLADDHAVFRPVGRGVRAVLLRAGGTAEEEEENRYAASRFHKLVLEPRRWGWTLCLRLRLQEIPQDFS